MKKLIVMCGIPGSGKSTYANNNLSDLSDSVKIVSRDKIRFSLVKEDEPYFSKETEVYDTFINEIIDGLNTNEIVIADATHLDIGSRTKLLRRLGTNLKDVKVIAFVMKVSLQTSIKHNENRKGTRGYVDPEIIKKMYSRFTLPTVKEGFDKVVLLREVLK